MTKIKEQSSLLGRPRWIGLILGTLLCLGAFSAAADPALRYQRASNRIERRDTRATNRIERRDTRITNRIERRDYLLSPPAGATRVAIGGVPYYRAGAAYYKPEFQEGQTVYVKVEIQ